MSGYMWRLALRESNASLEVHLANLSHILVEIWETPYLKYRILHSHWIVIFTTAFGFIMIIKNIITKYDNHVMMII